MDFYFLLFSLFFPRITMLVYFFQNWYPNNTVPFIGDLLLGVFIPRVLILIYIYQNMGYENIWFAAHLIVLILTYFGGGSETKRRYWKRKEA
jgi:NhaP-type Na+/H+ or K+/H+ antiporter